MLPTWHVGPIVGFGLLAAGYRRFQSTKALIEKSPDDSHNHESVLQLHKIYIAFDLTGLRMISR
jgi:hypothetical protein